LAEASIQGFMVKLTIVIEDVNPQNF